MELTASLPSIPCRGVLRIETQPDGAVDIEGDATDLLALAMWLKVAIQRGVAVTPGYQSGNPAAVIEITCTDPMSS